METKSSWRSVPAPLLVGSAVTVLYALVRVVILHSVSVERGFVKLQLAGEGVGFAATLLILLGSVELMNRVGGAARTMLKVAVTGVALAFTVDTLAGFVQFTKEPWTHEWVYKAVSYGQFAAWTAFAVGLALAAPAPKRVVGFIAAALTVFIYLPEPVANHVWTLLDGRTAYTAHLLVRAVTFGLLAFAAAATSWGETNPQPMSAAEGLRSAARGMWLRVIAAVTVVLFTLMLMTSRGGEGTVSFFKLVMMAQAVIGIIALTITGLGALRTARAGISDLQPYVLTIGGGASLWAAGVGLAQLPYIYHTLYGGSRLGGLDNDWMTALSLALPIVVIVGIGLLATALSGYAARRGNEDLRTDAQGKGIGFVVLLLTAIAIQTWMVPKSRSIGNFAMLSLLGAAASLWGTVMMAKLLGRAAEVVEEEPGIPHASIVSDQLPA